MLRAVLAAALLAAIPGSHAADCSVDIGVPVELHATLRAGDRFQGVRLLGALRLRDAPGDRLAVHGLSGLAWDADEGRLYALSDFGHLLHLEPRIVAGRLVGARLCGVYPLLGGDGRPLRTFARDAEGLALRGGRNGRRGDGELLVSFERLPRIARHAPDGRYIGPLELPVPLRDGPRYASTNQQLEAVTETRRFGLVTAPERPLADADGMTLYAADGHRWAWRLVDAAHAGLVDLATTGDDQLLVLERRYVSPLQPLIIALGRLDLGDDGTSARQADIVRFDSSEGWSLDNFEGLARHEGERYFMVADDNAGVLQHTLLVYFEVLGPAADSPPAPPPAPLGRHPL